MVDLAARFSAPSTLLCRANVRWRHSESNVSCLTVCATITFSSAPRTRGCFQEPYCCKLIRYGAAARAYLKVLARRPASGRFGLVDRTEPALAGIHFHLVIPPVAGKVIDALAPADDGLAPSARCHRSRTL